MKAVIIVALLPLLAQPAWAVKPDADYNMGWMDVVEYTPKTAPHMTCVATIFNGSSHTQCFPKK